MAIADRIRWDNIFRQQVDKPYPTPDPFLLQAVPPVDPRGGYRALDFAGGLGQNGIWLAEQGYNVDIMDISRVALHRARTEMAVRNLRNVNLLQVDVDQLQMDAQVYDVIAVFRYLKRNLFSLLKLATKSGGRIIYESYNQTYLTQVPQFNSKFLLDTGELREAFADWDCLTYDEDGHISRIVAVKP